MNRNELDSGLDMRLRTMRILWAALVVSVGLYALVGYFAAPAKELQSASGESRPLLYIFLQLGLSFVVGSFFLRRHFYRKGEREQRPELVQTGLILALVLCEVAALLGLTALFLSGDPFAYLLFVVAIVGDLFHFPRRDQLLAAYGSQAFRGQRL